MDRFPHLIWENRASVWTPSGYGRSVPKADVTVLTPPSTLGALAHGYVPVVHLGVL